MVWFCGKNAFMFHNIIRLFPFMLQLMVDEKSFLRKGCIRKFFFLKIRIGIYLASLEYVVALCSIFWFVKENTNFLQ